MAKISVTTSQLNTSRTTTSGESYVGGVLRMSVITSLKRTPRSQP